MPIEWVANTGSGQQVLKSNLEPKHCNIGVWVLMLANNVFDYILGGT